MSKINEYPQAVTINNNDLFVIDQESGGDHATKSASVAQIADKATSGVQSQIGDLSQLTTTDKSSLVGAVNEVVTGLNTDITFTLDSGAKFTVASFVGKKAGIVNILNLKLRPTEATTINTEIEVGKFANIYTYGSNTYYTGVIVDDKTKLVGSYVMTNRRLFLNFTDATTRTIALTLVVFSA